jgi:hypothetical protein
MPVDWRVCFCTTEVLLAGCMPCIGFHDVRGNSNVEAAVEGPLGGIGFGEMFSSRTLAMLTTLLAALATWDDMMAVVG